MLKIHLSVDDAIQIFHFLYKYEKSINSIFECRVLAFAQELHLKYGVKFTFYCLFENKNVKLSYVSDRFAEEFQANADWLKFGFHSKTGTTNYASDDTLYSDFVLTTAELKRIFQGEDNITDMLRLHFFAGSNKADISKMARCGVKALLTADDERKSYYLDNEYVGKEYYDCSNGIKFIPTLVRVENSEDIVTNIKEKIASVTDNQILTIFTHEWILNDEIKERLFVAFEYLSNISDKEYINTY